MTPKNWEILFRKGDNIPETESELLDDDNEPVTDPGEEVGDTVDEAGDFVETREVGSEDAVND
jgi:hypothetical protein